MQIRMQKAAAQVLSFGTDVRSQNLTYLIQNIQVHHLSLPYHPHHARALTTSSNPPAPRLLGTLFNQLISPRSTNPKLSNHAVLNSVALICSWPTVCPPTATAPGVAAPPANWLCDASPLLPPSPVPAACLIWLSKPLGPVPSGEAVGTRSYRISRAATQRFALVLYSWYLRRISSA
jgi:hypothetical protein